MIQAQCPNPACNRLLRMDEKLIGKRVKCIYCEQPFRVEAVTPAPEASAVASPDAVPQALPLDDVALSTSGPVAGNAFEGGRPTASGSTASVRVLTSVAVPAHLAPAPEPPAPENSEQDSESPSPVEPPPLPRRPRKDKEVEAGLRIGPSLISLLSVVIIIGSAATIVSLLLKPKVPVQSEVQSERWAAITIESRGVRLVIVDITHTSTGDNIVPVHLDNVDWELFKEPPATFPKNPPSDSMAKLEKILRDYDKTLSEQEVPTEYRLVACNTGALRPMKDVIREQEVMDWLQATTQKVMNTKLEYVDPEFEAQFGVRASIPLDKRGNSVCMDIGSGSTRYGYFNKDHFQGDAFEYGTKKAMSDINAIVKKEGTPFSTAAMKWQPKIAADTGKLANQVSQLKNCDNYYLLGGTPWFVAVLTQPTAFVPAPHDRAINVEIELADIDPTLKLVAENNFDVVKKNVLAKVPPGMSTKYLQEELTRIGQIFSQEQLIAGITLFQGLAKGCNFDSKKIQFFVRSLYAWPIGYIIWKSEYEKR